MTVDRDELKSCPFCGSSNLLSREGEQRADGSAGEPAAVICIGCDGRMFAYDLPGAIAAWNRRTLSATEAQAEPVGRQPLGTLGRNSEWVNLWRMRDDEWVSFVGRIASDGAVEYQSGAGRSIHNTVTHWSPLVSPHNGGVEEAADELWERLLPLMQVRPGPHNTYQEKADALALIEAALSSRAALSLAPRSEVREPVNLLNEVWQNLLDKDDRTSPEEYPDMVLITREEIAAVMVATLAADAARKALSVSP